MKNTIKIAGLTLAALCATQAWAETANRNTLGKLEKANRIIGMDIQDAQGQKIGKIKDLAVDLENGRIIEVIAATGGTLGVNERLVAVPPSQFACNADGRSVRLNVDQAQLKSAPAFKMANWESNTQQSTVSEVYQHYGDKPYYANGGDSSGTTTTITATTSNDNRFGRAQRAEKIIGTIVRNDQNEKIGKVENLLVDLPAGRVVEVIVSSGGFIGIGDELSAIPPQSFHQGSDRETLALSATKENLAQNPHFKSTEWPDVNNADQPRSVYSAYHVNPYFTDSNAAANNTAQNAVDRDNTTLTPTKQGNSQTDTEVTRRIRRDIIATKGLSVDAKNVKIITVDGRVTLRGPVKTEDEKRQLEEIVNKETVQGNVDNQLQVEGAATTTNPANQ